jgi:DME family drug/metabolite transporter
LRSNSLGYLYVFLSAALFAVIGVIGKNIINTGMSPFDLIVLQYSATIVIMTIYFLVTDVRQLKVSKEELKNIVIQGIIGSSGTTLFNYLSLKYLSAGVASMLLFTHPILINIYFLLSKTKKVNWINYCALMFAVLGSAMVINIFGFDISVTPVIGLVLGVLASASYAFFNIFAELKLKDAKPIVTTYYCSGIILLVTLILNPGFFSFNFTLTKDIIIYILELAVISGILPVVFLYKGIGIVGSDKASIVATVELPITVIIAYFVLSEKMNIIQITGIFFIIASIILLQSENNILKWLKNARRSE